MDFQFGGEIGRDESGKFWLIRGDEPAIIFASGIESHVSSYQSEIAAGDMEVSGAVMELSGGVEIPIYLVAHAYSVGLGRPLSVTSASCTVVVEEWYTYKTTSGQPAWSATCRCAPKRT
jgi:hypothetical protein